MVSPSSFKAPKRSDEMMKKQKKTGRYPVALFPPDSSSWHPVEWGGATTPPDRQVRKQFFVTRKLLAGAGKEHTSQFTRKQSNKHASASAWELGRDGAVPSSCAASSSNRRIHRKTLHRYARAEQSTVNEAALSKLRAHRRHEHITYSHTAGKKRFSALCSSCERPSRCLAMAAAAAASPARLLLLLLPQDRKEIHHVWSVA